MLAAGLWLVLIAGAVVVGWADEVRDDEPEDR